MNGGQKRRWWGEKAWDEVKVAGSGGWGDENEQLPGQVEQSELRAGHHRPAEIVQGTFMIR